MLLGCLCNRSDDLVGARDDVWHVDMDYAAPPVLGWRNQPNEDGEGDAYQDSNLPDADILADLGGYVPAW